MFELEDLALRLSDLREYLEQRVTGLNPEEEVRVGKGYGQLAGVMSELQRVMNLPKVPPPSLQSTLSEPAQTIHLTPASASTVPCTPAPALSALNSKRRKLFFPPSPGKLQNIAPILQHPLITFKFTYLHLRNTESVDCKLESPL